MTLLAGLLIGQANAATAADFFPLDRGSRRVYELKAKRGTTVIDEVGDKAYFDDKPAVSIVRRTSATGAKETTYYRVDGPTVLIVGYAEDRSRRSSGTDGSDGRPSTDTSNVLMPLVPAMPVFKYDGGATTWSYSATPTVDGRPTDSISIEGITKPSASRTVLGRKVETIEVQAEVKIGAQNFTQRIVEKTIYGRGIGLIESTRRTTVGKSTDEVKTKLVSLEDKPEGH